MGNSMQGKWTFVKTLDSTYEFHHKSLYPYNIDLATLEPIKRGHIQYDIYKFIGQ